VIFGEGVELDIKQIFSDLLGAKQHRALIGLDISSSAVKMVELSQDKHGYRVERFAVEILPRGAVSDSNIISQENVASTIQRAWKRLGSSTREVALALPSSAVITKRLALPVIGLREDEMEAEIANEASQYIPFALEEVNLDYQLLGVSANAPDEFEFLVAAAKKERVEDRVAVVEMAGLNATLADVEAFAVQAAFDLIQNQLPGGGVDQVLVLADIGATVATISIFRNGEILFNREQAFGGVQLTQDIVRHYDMPFEEAESAKRSGNLPADYENAVQIPFVESLALEISRALQFFFSSTQYKQVDHIVLSGGCATIGGIDQIIAARLQANTLIANPFLQMQLSERVKGRNLQADSPGLLVACGLALRRFDPV
jgi:type IV pilus assembly protein PilM